MFIPESRRHLFLLCSLTTLIVIISFVGDVLAWRIALEGFLALALLAGTFTASRTHLQLVVIGILALIFFGGRMLYVVSPAYSFAVINSVAGALFFASVAAILLRDIFDSDAEITMNMIFGSINVYVLLGLAFGVAYLALDTITPNSFDLPAALIEGTHTRLGGYVYFSFITMTTLDYGDSLPVTSPARTFSFLEAVAGQLYLTVLIARLVGLHITRHR